MGGRALQVVETSESPQAPLSRQPRGKATGYF